MESKTRNQQRLLDTQLSTIKEPASNETKDSQSQLNIVADNELLDPQQLRDKISFLLSRPNSQGLESDFRKTCMQYQEMSNSNPELNEAYQEYVKTYHKITSLYILDMLPYKNSLAIYETEREEMKILDAPKPLDWGTCIAQLPNGELFCFGNFRPVSGITLIIDSDYGYRKLPSGKPCSRSSAIYFNRSVYCFGGYNSSNLSLSSRYDLDENRWIELTPLPEADCWCSSAIFNGNILISGSWTWNIFIFSIDIDSFSTIPYQFQWFKCKILINAEERLYLIESNKVGGLIYESEIGDEYTWKRIKGLSPGFFSWQVFRSYNKGGMYISCIQETNHHDKESGFYKFSFSEKSLRILRF